MFLAEVGQTVHQIVTLCMNAGFSPLDTAFTLGVCGAAIQKFIHDAVIENLPDGTTKVDAVAQVKVALLAGLESATIVPVYLDQPPR